MNIHFIDREGEHDLELDLNSRTIHQETEAILAKIGRNAQSLNKLKGTQYEKRYINDYAEYVLIQHLCDKIKKSYEEVNLSISEFDEMRNKYEENNKRQTQEMNKLQNDLAELQQLLEEEKVESLDTEKKMDGLKQELANSESTISSLKEDIEKLNKDNESNESLKQVVNKLESDNRQLLAENEKLTNLNNDNKTQMTVLEEETNDLKTKLALIKDVYTKIQNLLNTIK